MAQVAPREPFSGWYFLLSLAAHALFIGVVFFISNNYVHDESPIVVLLTLEPGGGGGGGVEERQPPKIRKPRVRRGADRNKQIHRVADIPANPSHKPAPPLPVIPEEPLRDTSVPVHAESVQDVSNSLSASSYKGDYLGVGSGSGEGQGSGTGTGKGSGTGSGSGSGVGSGIGSSAGPGRGAADNSESLRERYRREHFAYIRDLILKHLEYPPLARKLGWSGSLSVSFVVLETGCAENIRIVKSSGFEILDRNVALTIREVQPFPRPPVKAELIIPVVYSLR